MMDWLILPGILVGFLLIISGVLILIEKAMGGDKEKTIHINDDTDIPFQGNDTVLNALSEEKIFVPSACGGKATCGFCKVRLIDDLSPLKPTEEAFISKEEEKEGVHLSCQTKVYDNMKIVLPKGLLSAKEFKTEITEVKDLTYDIKLVRFHLIDPATMDFKPGQYVQLKVPGIEIIRAYSIASDPLDKSNIELLIRYVPNGQATTFVHKALEIGDKLTITGPYGDFFLREESNRDMICIAGGSGKAPIRSILARLKAEGMPRKVKYFFGARSKRDLYYTEEFEQLSKEYPNFEYIPALSEPLEEDNWQGEVGLITDVVDRHTKDLSEAEGYLCGSPGMINACINVLSKHDMKEENVLFDKF
jgi:Na+-transporting NADH:ubiquinone oxidoreductase subunit F